MRISQLVFVIAFASSSVPLAAGQTVVTIDVNLNDSNANVDKLFLSNSMPHMMSKWDRLRYTDTKFRELCKALAPSSLRVLANPLFHEKEDSRKKKRSHKKSHGEDSKYSSSKDKFTNINHKEEEKDIQDSIPVDDLKDLHVGQVDSVRSNHRKSDHNTSGHGDSADKKENPDGLKQEKAQRAAHRRSSAMTFANRSEADMTVEKWEKLYSFTQYVGWDIFMDFTNLDRKDDNSWDDTQAKAFLMYAAKKNIKIPDFSIGNEPNLYREKYNISYITPNDTIRDYKELRYILKGFSLYKDSTVSGPETTRPSSGYAHFIPFAKYGGCQLVDEFSFHQYYRNLVRDKPTFADFMNTTVMDMLEFQINLGREYMSKQNCFKPIRITETSSVSGGGLENVADRFVAGFLWLDKLGVAARSGIKRVYRFNIWGVSYSLLNKNFEPYPDYYLTLLYKRLVEGKVYNATTDNKNVRAYANSARDLMYPKGSLVIYLLNVLDEPVKLILKQFTKVSVVTYFFTAGDDTEAQAVLAKTVKVNGVVMNHTMGGNVTFQPRSARGGSIQMPAQSFGFIVVPRSLDGKFEEDEGAGENSAVATTGCWSGLRTLAVFLVLLRSAF